MGGWSEFWAGGLETLGEESKGWEEGGCGEERDAATEELRRGIWLCSELEERRFIITDEFWIPGFDKGGGDELERINELGGLWGANF